MFNQIKGLLQFHPQAKDLWVSLQLNIMKIEFINRYFRNVFLQKT